MYKTKQMKPTDPFMARNLERIQSTRDIMVKVITGFENDPPTAEQWKDVEGFINQQLGVVIDELGDYYRRKNSIDNPSSSNVL